MLAARSACATDPWTLVQAQLQKNAGLVGNVIASTYELPGDDAPDTGSYQTHIQRWEKNGTPIRMSPDGSEPPKKSALALALAERFANHPDELFQTPESMVALGAASIDNRALSLYEVHGRFINGKLPINAKVWLDPASGALVKVAGAVTSAPVPGVKSIHFTLLYRTDSEGRSLPAKLTLDYSVNFFFHSGKILFAQEFVDWEKRPAL
ncbi:MAG: hypothetical protein V4476_22400 [Pseudomonadota bacterium]